MSTPLLELRQIKKSFGPTTVLDGVDFTVGAGEVVALLGDNGAGKSTLIKIIAGFHAPSSGLFLWEGREIAFSERNGPKEARKLGIETVYQNLGLVETLSITRNFFLGREVSKRIMGIPCLDLGAMQAVAKDKLVEIGVARNLDPNDSVAFLSGGERQAISISRARHFGAKLIIFDEPTSALSVKQTQKVLAYIREAADSGLGVIFITHTLAHLKALVDRIMVLFHGRVVGNLPGGDIDETKLAHLMTTGRFE